MLAEMELTTEQKLYDSKIIIENKNHEIASLKQNLLDANRHLHAALDFMREDTYIAFVREEFGWPGVRQLRADGTYAHMTEGPIEAGLDLES